MYKSWLECHIRLPAAMETKQTLVHLSMRLSALVETSSQAAKLRVLSTLRPLCTLRPLAPLATLAEAAEPAPPVSRDSRKQDKFMRESLSAAIAIVRHARTSRSAGLSPAASTPLLPEACTGESTL